MLLQQEKNRLLLESYELELEKERAQNNEVTFFEKIKIAAAGALGLRFKTLATANALNSESEKTEELETKITESKTKDFEISKKLLAIDKERADVVKKRSEFLEDIRLGTINTEEEKRAEELRQLEIYYDDLIQKAINYYGVLSPIVLELEESLAQKKKDINTKYAKEEEEEVTEIAEESSTNQIKWEELTQQEKANIISDGFNNLSTILGEETAAGKAAAIAAATINTFASAQSAYASLSGIPVVGPALAVAAYGAAIASGVATVKQIVATKTPGPSVAAPSIPTSVPATVQAPSFNIVGQGSGSQIASALGDQQQTPIQAFVVSQDVTSAQSLENGIIQGATLGG